MDPDRRYHHIIRPQPPRSHSSHLGWRTDNTRVLAQRQGVADMVMSPGGADHLDGDTLGEGEVLHFHAHSRNPRHRCTSNNEVVAVPPLHQEGEDSIRGDEGGIKFQQPPLDLVLVYLRDTGPIFRCFTFDVEYNLHPCTLMPNTDRRPVLC